MSSSSTIALARAFTKRSKRPEVSHPLPTREGSVRCAPGTIHRDQISPPIELISTTNVLAYTAPDIRSISSSSSNSSLRSAEESDFSHISRSFLMTPMTSAETSSVESSLSTPEPNHLSEFFSTPSRAATTAGMTRSSSGSSSDAPAVPQRALSHTKKSHQELARKRSRSRMTPPPNTLNKAQNVRSSHDLFRPSLDTAHPFGKELEQVNEVAEDFGASQAVLDEEEQFLMNKGLRKFGVEDYVMEIQGLYGGVFEDRLMPMRWI